TANLMGCDSSPLQSVVALRNAVGHERSEPGLVTFECGGSVFPNVDVGADRGVSRDIRVGRLRSAQHGDVKMAEVNILLVEDDEVDVMTVKRALKELKIANPLVLAKDG